MLTSGDACLYNHNYHHHCTLTTYPAVMMKRKKNAASCFERPEKQPKTEAAAQGFKLTLKIFQDRVRMAPLMRILEAFHAIIKTSEATTTTTVSIPARTDLTRQKAPLCCSKRVLRSRVTVTTNSSSERHYLRRPRSYVRLEDQIHQSYQLRKLLFLLTLTVVLKKDSILTIAIS
jgi:hypothetical protein